MSASIIVSLWPISICYKEESKTKFSRYNIQWFPIWYKIIFLKYKNEKLSIESLSFVIISV